MKNERIEKPNKMIEGVLDNHAVSFYGKVLSPTCYFDDLFSLERYN